MKIIAETASNHMGELDYLKDLSLQCKQAGADIVTVQVLNLEAFVTPADKLSYPNFVKVHLEADKWIEYFDWCKERDIEVLPCILDFPSTDLCKDYGFTTVKIHASDIVNHDFLSFVNQLFDKVFLEFGGADLNEIASALKVLSDTEVVLLYGFNAYPTKVENQNLAFLESLKYLFNCKTGFADHSVDNDFISLLAMAKGAIYLEKHVTLDSKDKDRFDWQVSVEPDSLKELVDRVKMYKPAFGEPLRFVSDSEKHFRKLVYKKLILKENLPAGTLLKEEDFDIKRSIEGVESTQVETFVGKELIKDLERGTPISYSDIK